MRPTLTHPSALRPIQTLRPATPTPVSGRPGQAVQEQGLGQIGEHGVPTWDWMTRARHSGVLRSSAECSPVLKLSGLGTWIGLVSITKNEKGQRIAVSGELLRSDWG